MNLAELKIESALDSFILGYDPKSVILNKLAKANLDMSNFFTYMFNNFGNIENTTASYIINELHKIRDHITITMGAIVGTEYAIDTANIIIEIDKLADDIFENQGNKRDKLLFHVQPNIFQFLSFSLGPSSQVH